MCLAISRYSTHCKVTRFLQNLFGYGCFQTIFWTRSRHSKWPTRIVAAVPVLTKRCNSLLPYFTGFVSLGIVRYHIYTSLTHRGQDNMAAISQTTLSNAFSLMKMLDFRLKIHWSLSQHVSRQRGWCHFLLSIIECLFSLQWRHNGCNGVSNHRRLDC